MRAMADTRAGACCLRTSPAEIVRQAFGGDAEWLRASTEWSPLPPQGRRSFAKAIVSHSIFVWRLVGGRLKAHFCVRDPRWQISFLTD